MDRRKIENHDDDENKTSFSILPLGFWGSEVNLKREHLNVSRPRRGVTLGFKPRREPRTPTEENTGSPLSGKASAVKRENFSNLKIIGRMDMW